MCKILNMSQGVSFACRKKKLLLKWDYFSCILVSKRTHIDLTCYSNTDFGGYKIYGKSTSRTCYFLRHLFASWFDKKQNLVAFSITEG